MAGPTGDWNEEYIGAHPGGYLHQTAEVLHAHDRALFVRTCCVITVEAVLWKSGVDCARWTAHDAPADTCMVEFDGGEHVVLIHEGCLYQSYYRKAEVRYRTVTPELLASLGDAAAAWRCIVGDLNPEYVPHRIEFFW